MSYLIDLATKNLFRNKLRSFISILAIALSVALVVFVKGLVGAFIDNMYSLHIQYQAGDIKIIDQEYQKKERLLSLNYPVDGFNGGGIKAMEGELKRIKGIKRVIPRIKFGAAISTEDEMIRMMGWGVEASKELEFTNIKDKLVEGRMVRRGQREVVMGADLLKKIGLKVGDKTTILYQTSFASFKGSTFKIVGKIKSGLKLLDEELFYLPLDQAQKILEMPDMATDLLLETDNYRDLEGVLAKVEQLFKDKSADQRYSIIPWDKGYSMIGMLKVGEKIYNGIYIFLVILGAFVVINTMIMIVKERTKEVGMMTALGVKSKEILSMFIIEGIIMGMVGSFLGVIVGALITKLTAITGIIDYSKAMKGVSGNILMNPIIRPEVDLSNLLYAFILGVVVTAITAIIPARKAAKLDPTEALRSN
ncbi:putative ABC transport system permease protein [Orenia metallireducens]|uniref:Putative ABC transport system permease protein n=1 Tax=Orenia metallireducens TaxID=1413210 RepID=A0A285F2K0_9FIRM|nr:FtsX-like permease family protein [Orenia metallireducens]PRX34756.1 putative ABC transport system permease protein [Orenia metallireducens]SNY05502.1 putative ABC transport system permease protein [Orenia metallireducens]